MPAIPEKWRTWAVAADKAMTMAASSAINGHLETLNPFKSSGPPPGGVPARVAAFNYLVERGNLIQTPKGKIDVEEPAITPTANQFLVERFKKILPENWGEDEMDWLHVKEVMEFREGATQVLLETGVFFINKKQFVDIKPGLFAVPQDLEPAGSVTGSVQA